MLEDMRYQKDKAVMNAAQNAVGELERAIEGGMQVKELYGRLADIASFWSRGMGLVATQYIMAVYLYPRVEKYFKDGE